ncbi:MAG: MFS transporter [Candidatus Dormibacteraceae bacterium]
MVGKRASRLFWVTVGLLFLAWLVDYIDRLVITIALPFIGVQFHIDKTLQGLVLSAFFLSYTLFQIPGGLIADKVGAKRTMTAAMVLWSGFTALTGAAGSFGVLLVVRFVFGIWEGIFPGASFKAISERTEPARRMTANGLMLASNNFGSAVAPLIAAPAIALVGWQHTFFWIAGAGVVMAIVLWFALPRPLPREQSAAEAVADPATLAETPAKSPFALIGIGAMWKYVLMWFGADLVGWGLASWVPSYLLTVRHLPLVQTGIVASIPGFVGAISTIVGGRLFDRYFHDRHHLLIAPALVLEAIFLFLMLRSGTVAEFVVFEACATAMGGLVFMPIMGVPMRTLPADYAASGSALINFGGQAAGFTAPIVMGFLAQTFSFQAAFGLLVAGALLGAVCSLWAPSSPAAFRRAVGSRLALGGGVEVE